MYNCVLIYVLSGNLEGRDLRNLRAVEFFIFRALLKEQRKQVLLLRFDVFVSVYVHICMFVYHMQPWVEL